MLQGAAVCSASSGGPPIRETRHRSHRQKRYPDSRDPSVGIFPLNCRRRSRYWVLSLVVPLTWLILLASLFVGVVAFAAVVEKGAMENEK